MKKMKRKCKEFLFILKISVCKAVRCVMQVQAFKNKGLLYGVYFPSTLLMNNLKKKKKNESCNKMDSLS